MFFEKSGEAGVGDQMSSASASPFSTLRIGLRGNIVEVFLY